MPDLDLVDGEKLKLFTPLHRARRAAESWQPRWHRRPSPGRIALASSMSPITAHGSFRPSARSLPQAQSSYGLTAMSPRWETTVNTALRMR